MDARWVLAFHGWSVMTNVDNRAEVPFYLLPSLGGANTLRGFPDYRFHDLHLLLTTAEARFALFDHVDLAAFVDAGSVAARIRQLDLGARSYGLGVRLHSGRATFLRIDAAHGREGWNVLLRLGDPLHLSRLSRRLAALPFVP
jgi:outer membrane protein assembly factor BamA